MTAVEFIFEEEIFECENLKTQLGPVAKKALGLGIKPATEGIYCNVLPTELRMALPSASQVLLHL